MISLAVLLGSIQLFCFRHDISTADGLSYIDIAEAYLKGDWNHVANAYWSPLYSWIIAIFLFIFQPGVLYDFQITNIANLFIFIFSITSFDFCLQRIIATYRARCQPEMPIPEWFWTLAGYGLFLWCSLTWIGPRITTPDLLVSACIYWAVGILLDMKMHGTSRRSCVLLAFALSLGYLAKAAVFPVALVIIVVAASLGKDRKCSLVAVAGILALFLTFSAPWITAISLQKGHITFGESGRINYIWNVNHLYLDDYGREDLARGGKLIWKDPPTLEIAEPIGGSYSVWYDPSYWNLDLPFKFDLGNLCASIVSNVQVIWKEVPPVFWIGSVILLAWDGSPKRVLKNLMANHVLLIPALAGIGLYLMVLVEVRYIASYLVLLFLGLIATFRIAAPSRFFATAAATGVLFLSAPLMTDVVTQFQRIYETLQPTWEPSPDVQVANALVQDLGLRPGTRLAGVSHGNIWSYWAHHANMRITVDITDPARFWRMEKAEQEKLFEQLVQNGVRAVVAEVPDPVDLVDEKLWKHVGNTRWYVRTIY
jgi:hypothetical protein